jgi:hypothetical protein
MTKQQDPARQTFARLWAVAWGVWGVFTIFYEVRGRMFGFPPGEVFGGPWAWLTLLIPAHVVSYALFRLLRR